MCADDLKTERSIRRGREVLCKHGCDPVLQFTPCSGSRRLHNRKANTLWVAHRQGSSSCRSDVEASYTSDFFGGGRLWHTPSLWSGVCTSFNEVRHFSLVALQ